MNNQTSQTIVFRPSLLTENSDGSVCEERTQIKPFELHDYFPGNLSPYRSIEYFYLVWRYRLRSTIRRLFLRDKGIEKVPEEFNQFTTHFKSPLKGEFFFPE